MDIPLYSELIHILVVRQSPISLEKIIKKAEGGSDKKRSVVSESSSLVSMESFDEGFELKEIQKLEGHSDRVWSLAWNPASGHSGVPLVFASCSGDKTVRIWEQNNSSGIWDCKVRVCVCVCVSACFFWEGGQSFLDSWGSFVN